MTTFDKREHGFEAKFAHDEEMEFTAEARASKLFGLWAAAKLDLNNEDAQKYASDLVVTNLEEAGHEDILRKVRKDFAEKGVTVSEHIMQVELDKAIAEAHK